MKDQFLKLAGAKNEKEFYKLFPTEEAFKAKYGKKIEKLLRNEGIEKAQGGIKAGLNSFSNYQPKGIPAQPEFKAPDEVFSFSPETGNKKNKFLSDFGNISDDDVVNTFNAGSAIGKSVQNYASARDAKKKAKQEGEYLRELSPLVAKANQGDMDRPQRKYLRPDHPAFLIQPDTLHNPLGSGQGLYAKNGTEIANTFAPNTIYTDLGKADAGAIMAVAAEAVNTVGDMAAWFGGMNTRKLQKENEKLMSQMGAQPMMQNLQATQYGSYMEDGGRMDFLRTGGNIRHNEMPMNGNLKVDGKGDIEYIAYNPEVAKTGANGFIGISRGPSHDDGGFNIAYGENGFTSDYAKAGAQSTMPSPSIVEIEGGETVIESANGSSLQGKNLNILGNLKVGILDKSVSDGINETVMSDILKRRNLKDVKYKTASYLGGRETQRTNRAENKYLKLIDSDDLLTSSSAKAGLEGVQMRYKNLKNFQDNLINSQLAINTTAEEMGLNPDKLAYRGKVEKAKTGGKLSTADKGVQKKTDERDPLIIDPSVLPNVKMNSTGTVEDAANEALSYFKTQSEEPFRENYPAIKERMSKRIMDSMNLYANQLYPFIRPSDAEGLSPEQIAGELMAISTNQVVPVQMQKFSPRLQSMRNVSFDEQYARNQDDFNAMMRRVGNNPSALSALGAEKYKADRQIADAAFKTNEGLAQATMAQNLEALNKADLINLELIDKQYGRQEQAISNTKATQQAALNSINAKILENRNLMNSLRTFENLYNYRFDKGFRATNMNAPATFNMEGSGSPGTSFIANYTPEQLKLMAAQKEYEEKQQERLTKGTSKKSNGGLVQAYKKL